MSKKLASLRSQQGAGPHAVKLQCLRYLEHRAQQTPQIYSGLPASQHQAQRSTKPGPASRDSNNKHQDNSTKVSPSVTALSSIRSRGTNAPDNESCQPYQHLSGLRSPGKTNDAPAAAHMATRARSRGCTHTAVAFPSGGNRGRTKHPQFPTTASYPRKT